MKMKILALAGAGKICREAALDLVTFGNFERITIADYNEDEARNVAQRLNSSNVDWCKIDIRNQKETIKIMQAYDLVMDGSTISLNDLSTACIAEAGCHGINLNGFGKEYKYGNIFKQSGKIMVPGFGMTPGTTNMMTVYVVDQMDEVESVRISHGAFRPFAFSESIAETTMYEYDPSLAGRVVYENGKFVQVPPFARPLEVQLPEPYGKHVQYIIPHSETITLAEYLKPKNIKLIEVRGTWPPENMRLLSELYNWGFLQNTAIEINGHKIGIMEAISKFLINSEKAKNTELYGYALHVEVVGIMNGKKVKYIVTHTHPASDGSVPGWEKLRAYTRCVGIPFAIAVHMIAKHKYSGEGVLIPEKIFDPKDIFIELKKRDIHIHEEVHELGITKI